MSILGFLINGMIGGRVKAVVRPEWELCLVDKMGTDGMISERVWCVWKSGTSMEDESGHFLFNDLAEAEIKLIVMNS